MEGIPIIFATHGGEWVWTYTEESRANVGANTDIDSSNLCIKISCLILITKMSTTVSVLLKLIIDGRHKGAIC